MDKKLACLMLLYYQLSLFGCGPNTTTLTWTDTSNDEAGFRIYRIVGQEKKLVAQVGANTTVYIDKNSPPNACYLVTAFNAAGESPPTAVACIE